MKTFMLIGILLSSLVAPVYSDQTSAELIQGYWNLNTQKGPYFRESEFNNVRYKFYYGSGFSIIPWDDGTFSISQDQYGYNILQIRGKYPVIDLLLSQDGVTGVLRLHFLTPDSMWREAVPSKEGDPDFAKLDFGGKSVIYVRAPKLKPGEKSLPNGE